MDQYQVVSTDPLAEMFKHAANTSPFEINCVNSTIATSDSSFYSTPLNHILPSKYQGLDNIQHTANSVSYDATLYFSAEATLSGTLPHINNNEIIISSSSSSCSSPDPDFPSNEKETEPFIQKEESTILTTPVEGIVTFL